MHATSTHDAWADWDDALSAHMDAVRALRVDVAESGADIDAMGAERTAHLAKAARYVVLATGVRLPAAAAPAAPVAPSDRSQRTPFRSALRRMVAPFRPRTAPVPA